MNGSESSERGIERTLRNWSGAIKPRELSAVIKVALCTIYRYAKKGVLPSLPLPGIVRFDPNIVADVLYGKGPK